MALANASASFLVMALIRTFLVSASCSMVWTCMDLIISSVRFLGRMASGSSVFSTSSTCLFRNLASDPSERTSRVSMSTPVPRFETI